MRSIHHVPAEGPVTHRAVWGVRVKPFGCARGKRRAVAAVALFGQCRRSSSRKRGDAVGRVSGRSSLLGQPNAKFFAENRRALRERTGTCNRAAQVIIRGSVAARKMWACQPEDVLHMLCKHTLRQQLPGDPQINDAPVGLKKSLGDAPSLHPVLVNLLGLCCIQAAWDSPGRRGATVEWMPRDRAMNPPFYDCRPVHRLQQGIGIRSQTSVCLHDSYPRSITVEDAPLLIGEPRKSSQVTPIGAGRVSSVKRSQMLPDRGSHGGFQWHRADVNPCLEMTRAGLHHHTGLMAIGPHGLENRWRRAIQIEQNVTRVGVLGVGPDVDITALAVANAQKSNRSRRQQLARSPKPLSRKRPHGGVVDQTDQKQIVRHGRELAADRTQRNPESAIDARGWFVTWLARKGVLCRKTLQATGSTTRISNCPTRAWTDSHPANSENQLESSSQKETSFFSERTCIISAVSHGWGSPQVVSFHRRNLVCRLLRRSKPEIASENQAREIVAGRRIR